MDEVMQFVRGDGNYHTFSIPTSSWSANGRLFFAAKPEIDDDPTDSNSVISQSWGDSNVTDVVINGLDYKQYNCYFPPSATINIPSGGAGSAEYLGEFEYVPSTGVPITFPATDDKLDVTVYFDVKIGTTT
jgi:hypothetical protein